MNMSNHVKQQVVHEFFSEKGLILQENGKTVFFFYFIIVGKAENILNTCCIFCVEAMWHTVFKLLPNVQWRATERTL